MDRRWPTAAWIGNGMLVFGGEIGAPHAEVMYFWQPPVTAYLYRRP
jgi:hypothetical protein